MYKICAFLLFSAMVCAAIPVDQQVDLEDIQQYEPEGRHVRSAILDDQQADLVDVEEYEHAGRHARATCDLLSFEAKGVSVGHAACAAHCLALGGGRRGGRCIDGVCHCRK